MRKAITILVLALMTVGFYSCEAETDVQETEATFKQLQVDQNATDGEDAGTEGRAGN